ncbi:hypothetical protein J4446_03605 [Candidatus Woesearchaeota archaeon]|nr:hypothetical protein [Candidatus Woesearchaeota archaeon]
MKKLLPYIVTFLVFISSSLARESFNLEYKVEGPFPLNKNKSTAQIVYDNNKISGKADFPLYSFIFRNINLSFNDDFNKNIHMENNDTTDIPDSYMSLLEGLLDYMNYIDTSGHIEPRDYKLFVTGRKKQVYVDIKSKAKDNLVVKVSPLNDNYLIEKPTIKIPEITVHFRNGIPVKAHAQIKLFGIHTSAYGYLKP